jgi:hypothetical protein
MTFPFTDANQIINHQFLETYGFFWAGKVDVVTTYGSEVPVFGYSVLN